MAIQRGRNKFATPKSTGLIITSLIDFFTIVVIYLMKSYSAEGSIMTNADNLVLPNSISTTKPKEVHVQVAATSDMILIDNNPVVPTEDVRKIPQDAHNPVIPQLEQKLKIAKKLEEDQVKLGAANIIEGTATIQIDKNVEFDVLYKVMHTCASVGYMKMNFAVMEREM
ncbi:MAG: biopolymer transporter ExbD [Chitinispirillaceae bacterium]|nr:biopolymer transporter ExbD [Chitinispirillaceae bacterium]